MPLMAINLRLEGLPFDNADPRRGVNAWSTPS